MTLRRAWSWLNKEQEICKYVAELEAKVATLEYNNAAMKRDKEILTICPNVRGIRYKFINLPDWFQLKNLDKLGRDFADYVQTEALPTQLQ